MLREAVASVRAQTRSALEHIIVDDGSYSVDPIEGITVVHTAPRGPGPARNVGIALASGEAIALLDDDDLWHPHHLDTVWSAMQANGADIVYADCVVENRRDGYDFEVVDFDGDLLMQRNFLCLHATLVRTASLRAIGGFPNEPRGEDWSLWKRMHLAGMRFHHVPVPTVTYRFHTDNLTYGGVDPEVTRAVKELEEAATRQDISWEEFQQRSAKLWSS